MISTYFLSLISYFTFVNRGKDRLFYLILFHSFKFVLVFCNNDEKDEVSIYEVMLFVCDRKKLECFVAVIDLI